jgi:hypothetical protein
VLGISAAGSAVAAAQALGPETCSRAAPCGAQRLNRSMWPGSQNARPSGGERLRCSRSPAEARPHPSDGVQPAVARTEVSPSLPPTTAPLRKTAGRRVPSPTRHRRVPVELLLIVRRAERAVMVTDPRVPGRSGATAPRGSALCPSAAPAPGARAVTTDRIQLDVNPRTARGGIDDQC